MSGVVDFKGMPVPRDELERAIAHMETAHATAGRAGTSEIKLRGGTAWTLGLYFAAEANLSNDQEGHRAFLEKPNVFWGQCEMAYEENPTTRPLRFDGTDERANNLSEWSGFPLPGPSEGDASEHTKGGAGEPGTSGAKDAKGNEKPAPPPSEAARDEIEERAKMFDGLYLRDVDDQEEWAQVVKASGGKKPAIDGGAKNFKSEESPFEVADVEKEVNSMVTSRLDKATARKELNDYELGAKRYMRLAIAMHCGKIPTDEQMEGMVFMGDFTTSSFAAVLRKAKFRMLPEVINSKDMSKITAFFTRIAKAYHAKRCHTEANVINQCLSNMLGLEDVNVLCSYLELVLVKFEGRVLPVEIDGESIFKAKSKSSEKNNSDHKKEWDKEKEEMKKEIASLRKKMNEFGEGGERNRRGGGVVGDRERGDRRGRGGDRHPADARPGDDLENVRCYKCQKLGHLARDCPEEA